MIYSNGRKLYLSGWLKQHNELEYNTPLKLQKFLLFYEAFTKVSGETPDFDHLRGYKRGPVFSNVWGDYTKERELFDKMAEKRYSLQGNEVNEERALKCAFIVAVLSERELSDLTHRMNIWKAKEKRILAGERQVELEERDFNQDDRKLISLLDQMYPIDMIKNSAIVSLDNNFFVFQKKDATQLTEEHFDTLMSLAEKESLNNPVYVEINEEGRLIID